MRVKHWIDIEQEIEVEVSVASMLTAITDMPEEERLPCIITAINTAHAVLKRVPDNIIREMNFTQRNIIAEALWAQAARYSAIRHRDEKK